MWVELMKHCPCHVVAAFPSFLFYFCVLTQELGRAMPTMFWPQNSSKFKIMSARLALSDNIRLLVGEMQFGKKNK